MSTLIEKHDSMSSPQSSISINRDTSMQKQRPSHNPPKNLTQNEIYCLYDILENDCVTLATAVVQILYGCNNVWEKQACGVLCFVKDYKKRVYCFRLYNLRLRKSIYEEVIPSSVRLEKALNLFYTFDGMKCKVGINFVDLLEAETFCKHFHKKQEDLQKKISNQKLQNLQQSSTSMMMNVIKAPSNDIIKTPLPIPISEKPVKSNMLEHKKNKKNRPVITEPILSSFVHVIHVAHEDSFVKDDAKKNLFEEVLTSMRMTPDEELYIRRIIKSTDDGLEKLFTRQQTSDYKPEIPPRTYSTAKSINRKHIPYQDISDPSSIYDQTSSNRPQPQIAYNTSIDSEQSTAPPIPPRSTRRAPDNTQQSIKISLPPPPPPPPMFLSEQTTHESPTPSLNSQGKSFLKDIRDFNTVKLKPASQRSSILTKPTENKSHLDTEHTIAENIREILTKRRLDFIRRDDEEDKSDSSDDEWSN